MRLATQEPGFDASVFHVWRAPTDRRAALAILRRAIESGVNLIDTADAYALGETEELIAGAPRPVPRRCRHCKVLHSSRGFPSRRARMPRPLAWLLHRSPTILPIPGTTSPAHVDQNIAAAWIQLSDNQFERLSAIAPPTKAPDPGVRGRTRRPIRTGRRARGIRCDAGHFERRTDPRGRARHPAVLFRRLLGR
ncbi:aldo/keto reductase [Nocardia vinacea]|uniref:aldo/keto reductase n=1 Tax=Nocardia vinacea TaxID=96468 RepID=UPI003F4D94FD